jgi:hypothetical protein
VLILTTLAPNLDARSQQFLAAVARLFCRRGGIINW